MIEVFKTNVTKPVHAAAIVSAIRSMRGHYHVNFDLDDCDRIMRVKSERGEVEKELLIKILGRFGFKAAILDDVPAEHS